MPFVLFHVLFTPCEFYLQRDDILSCLDLSRFILRALGILFKAGLVGSAHVFAVNLLLCLLTRLVAVVAVHLFQTAIRIVGKLRQLAVESVELTLHGCQLARGIRYGFSQFAGIDADGGGDVQAEVAVSGIVGSVTFSFLIDIDEPYIGIDESAECIDVAKELERADTLVFPVIDHGHVHAALEGLLTAGGRQGESECDTDRAHRLFRYATTVQLLSRV